MFHQIYYKTYWFLKDVLPHVALITFLLISGTVFAYFHFIKKENLRKNLIYSVLLSASITVILMFTIMRDQANNNIQGDIFNSVNMIINGDGESLIDFGFNVLLFVPFSILFRLKNSVVTTLLVVLVLSLCIEMTQLYCRVGLFEVSDIIANFLGGIAGILLINASRYIMDRISNR
ncbi:MAG: VanZ family protein [Ruminococcus sp.]|nr:VanZ family protein [Ruminococcus sp.]